MSFQGQNKVGGGGGGGALNTLKGNSGGFVGPDVGGNIDIIGDGSTIDVVGNPGTNTLTISATGSTALFFTADDTNVASPIAGNLNVFGSTNINTTAPGSTDVIRINLNDSILLPATTDADHGVIALGVDLTNNRFLHNSGMGSSFVGTQAGNFTTTGMNNQGFGLQALTAITSGASNSAFGTQSLGSLTTGSANTAFGEGTLATLTTGSFNVAVGGVAGIVYSTESNNIVIGNQGTAADANTIRIGTQGSGNNQQNQAYMAGIYNTAFGGTNQVVFVDNQGKLGSSTGTDGQVLIGSSAGPAEWVNITSLDNTVTIINGANVIDLSTGGGAVFMVTTNDATPTPIVIHALTANSAVTVRATIVSAKSDFSESLFGEAIFGARRVGAGAILVDIPIISFGDDSVGSPGLSCDVNGNNVRLLVTGVAASTWNWKATISFITQP